ncbi:hypothetical protein GCM10009122_02090 [Fulvivirga kasyanovii]
MGRASQANEAVRPIQKPSADVKDMNTGEKGSALDFMKIANEAARQESMKYDKMLTQSMYP